MFCPTSISYNQKLTKMDAFIEYFSNMPTAHRSFVLVGGLTIFFLIENAAPLFEMHYNRAKHTGLNIFFTITTILVNFSILSIS